ncbi:MAG: single-stranded DNA-binding protein [Candidatus Hydrogenedentota bacterium]
MNLMQITDQLCDDTAKLAFEPPITTVYNPLQYARAGWEAYIRAFGGKPREILLLGMNPGPFGMVQTGVPFGDVPSVRDWMGIETSIAKPSRQHPRRPVDGFSCSRREVSGRRLWGWAAKRFGKPERFFERFFVSNYCPLCFLEESGRNRTPDKLKAGERIPLFRACDSALASQVDYFRPQYILGIGAFAEKRIRKALEGRDLQIGRLLHPSPANPAANRGWEDAVEKTFKHMGIDI